jgi:6-phosphogluconolactonase
MTCVSQESDPRDYAIQAKRSPTTFHISSHVSVAVLTSHAVHRLRDKEMDTRRSSLLVLIGFLSLSLSCGGGNPGGGVVSKPPSTTEILYASDFGNSVFSFNLDASTGALTEVATATIPSNGVQTSSIALTPSGNFLFATTGTSGISAYSSTSSGTMSLISGSPFPNSTTQGISSLTVDPNGSFLYASDSSDFGVGGFTIGTTGALTSIPGGPFSPPGDALGPPTEIAIDPAGKFLYASTVFDVSDTGGLNVWGFTIDSQTGALTSMPGSPFATQENGQPHGIKVDPSGKFVYVALSNANSIAAFTIDSTTGALTVAPGSPFATGPGEFTETYELTIAPSGKFLYAFNFNGNTVAVFTIDSTSGVLTTVAGSPFAVNPEAEGDLVVDPSGKFLYLTIASGLHSAFDIFNIDPNTGALTPNLNSPIAGNEAPISIAVAQFH